MDISVPPEKSIGVFLSGGMDSALLLYLLRKKLPNSIQPITVPKHDGATNYIPDIITWVIKKTNKPIDEPCIIGNPDLHHSSIVGDALWKCFRHKIADVYYMGSNAYPENILPNGPKRIKVPGIYYPFFDLYKSDIVRMYVENDIMDLLELTHTCTEQAVGRCGLCWQCRERQWAFKECGIEDLTNT